MRRRQEREGMRRKRPLPKSDLARTPAPRPRTPVPGRAAGRAAGSSQCGLRGRPGRVRARRGRRGARQREGEPHPGTASLPPHLPAGKKEEEGSTLVSVATVVANSAPPTLRVMTSPLSMATKKREGKRDERVCVLFRGRCDWEQAFQE